MASGIGVGLGGIWQRTEGASAVEFALVVPIFFSLVFGIIVYGSYFASLSIINEIAFEAARASVTGLTDAERASLATSRATTLVSAYGAILNTESVSVSAVPAGTGVFAVTVTHEFDAFGIGAFSAFLPMPPAEQSATVQMARGGY